MGEENIERIKTDEEPAPEETIAYVRCKCDPTLQKSPAILDPALTSNIV